MKIAQAVLCSRGSIKTEEVGIAFFRQRATPFSPSRPARGCAVLASALRAALTAALRRGGDLSAGNPACR
jgi:hypothetical protein